MFASIVCKGELPIRIALSRIKCSLYLPTPGVITHFCCVIQHTHARGPGTAAPRRFITQKMFVLHTNARCYHALLLRDKAHARQRTGNGRAAPGLSRIKCSLYLPTPGVITHFCCVIKHTHARELQCISILSRSYARCLAGAFGSTAGWAGRLPFSFSRFS